jgi:hypothetical protein
VIVATGIVISMLMAATVIAVAREVIVVMAAVHRALAQVAPAAYGKNRDQALGLLALAMGAPAPVRVLSRGDLLKSAVTGFALKFQERHPPDIVPSLA